MGMARARRRCNSSEMQPPTTFSICCGPELPRATIIAHDSLLADLRAITGLSGVRFVAHAGDESVVWLSEDLYSAWTEWVPTD
jgi:hypothetical protein